MRTVFLLLLVSALFCSGCAWMGRTAGKAQAKIERKVDDVQDGYNRGYKEERAKEEQ